MRPDKHAASVEIANCVIVERRQNEALFTIDRAARHRHIVLGMLDQMFCDRERIGHHLHATRGHVMHHLERRRSAIDDDRFTLVAQIDGLTRN
ncbi:hypothetical protein D3C71_922230 [compost metagenome]